MEWEIDSFSKKYLKEITDAAKNSEKISIATQEARKKLLKIYLPSIGTVFHISR